MARRREPLPQKPCEYAPCGELFTPDRKGQRFHSHECNRAWWAAHYATEPHTCPFCHVRHDPEDPEVLNALEMLLRTEAGKINVIAHGYKNTSEHEYIRLETLLGFIERRRGNC